MNWALRILKLFSTVQLRFQKILTFIGEILISDIKNKKHLYHQTNKQPGGAFFCDFFRMF